MQKHFVSCNTLIALALGFLGSVSNPSISAADTPTTTTETLILLRHGEKTAHEYGQLSIKGLNRSLALPDVLIGKYGKPDFIFAPNPAAQIHGKNDPNSYSYVRPFATIEPTAIKLGMPVNTQFGFTDIQHLQSELTQPVYANAVVFVAWEHVYLDLFAKNVVKTYGGGDAVVPPWPGSDYDSIFVIRLQHSGDKTTLNFTVDHEGLNDKVSDGYPTAAGG